MSMLPLDVLQTRLKNELNLCRKEVRCKIIPVDTDLGHFPLRYQIKLLDLPGPITVDGAVRMRYLHLFTISIPREYPFGAPSIEWETPVYHPNIQPPDDGGNVHLSYLKHWNVKSSLVHLLKAIKTLLIFPNLDEVFNTTSCLNALKYFKNRDIFASVEQPDVFIAEHAFAHMVRHCHSLLTNQLEALGFLIGDSYTWNGRTYTIVKDVITDDLDTTAVSVKFSDAAFEGLFDKLDALEYDYLLVGWYHSHPGYGCYMSSTDLTTQERMFSHLHQSAIVVDPKKLDLKIFGLCRDGAYFERPWAIYSGPLEDEAVVEAEPSRTKPSVVRGREPAAGLAPAIPSPSEWIDEDEAGVAVESAPESTGPAPAVVEATPDGGAIIIGCCDRLVALDRDGARLWSQSLIGDVIKIIILGDPDCIVVAAENQVFGFDRSGAFLWVVTTVELVSDLVALDDEHIVIVGMKGSVSCLDRTGAIIWQRASLPIDENDESATDPVNDSADASDPPPGAAGDTLTAEDADSADDAATTDDESPDGP